MSDSWVQYAFLLAAVSSPVISIVTGVFLVYRSYISLQAEVADLTKTVRELVPQAKQIEGLAVTYAELAGKIAEVQRDIVLIKRDLGMIREHQQRGAYDDPEKGSLDRLETAKHRPPGKDD